MDKYRATNYSMGVPVKVADFEAGSPTSAMSEAERRVPGANGLGQGGKRATIIGVRRLTD
jgi:hypothetical protein